MTVIFILIFISLSLAVIFLSCFVWAVRSGQYEDTCTPSMRVLADDTTRRPAEPTFSEHNTNIPK